jgi:hypothetical protein
MRCDWHAIVARALSSATLATCALAAGSSAHAATGTPEYLLKAAFIYNFAQFTSWTERQDHQLHVCVLGRDPFGDALDSLNGKDIAATRIAVLRLRSAEEAMRVCQIVFVADGEVDGFLAHNELFRQNHGVLTIADREGAARAGVMIELTLDDRKVGFEFNQRSAQQGGVVISSKLLRLARKVY